MDYLDAITFTITSVYSTLDEKALKELSEFLKDKAGGIDLHLKERTEEKEDGTRRLKAAMIKIAEEKARHPELKIK